MTADYDPDGSKRRAILEHQLRVAIGLLADGAVKRGLELDHICEILRTEAIAQAIR